MCLQFLERQTAHVKAYLQIKHKNSLIVRKPVTRSFRAHLLKKGVPKYKCSTEKVRIPVQNYQFLTRFDKMFQTKGVQPPEPPMDPPLRCNFYVCFAPCRFSLQNMSKHACLGERRNVPVLPSVTIRIRMFYCQSRSHKGQTI